MAQHVVVHLNVSRTKPRARRKGACTDPSVATTSAPKPQHLRRSRHDASATSDPPLNDPYLSGFSEAKSRCCANGLGEVNKK